MKNLKIKTQVKSFSGREISKPLKRAELTLKSSFMNTRRRRYANSYYIIAYTRGSYQTEEEKNG